MQVTGHIKVIMDVQTFDSGFTKREFVITTQEQYPQDLKFELIKDKTSLIDKFKVGDRVTVSLNLRGNEYNGKYYVNLGAWKIEAATVQDVEPIQEEPVTSVPPLPEDSDLPF